MADDRDFGAKVPTTEYERFRNNFPMYGATTWFINTALKRFNDAVERNPSMLDKVDEAIIRMVEINRVQSSLDKAINALEEERSPDRVSSRWEESLDNREDREGSE